MPVPINWALNGILGVATAYAVRAAPGLHIGRMPWPLLWLGALQAVLLTPIATALFRFYPHWSTLYCVDPAVYPHFAAANGLLSALFVLGNFTAMALGFAAARHSLRQGQRGWARSATWGPVALLGGCLGRWPGRLAYVGDFDTFWQGKALWLAQSPCGKLSAAAWLGAAAFVLVLRHRYARRDPTYI